MENYYYNLSGGINQASTKTELGLDTKKIYWSDSQNVEILQNKGIKRQNGNVKIAELETNEKITAIHQMKYGDFYKVIIVTVSGKLYIYSSNNNNIVELSKTLNSSKPTFVNFLNGVLISSKTDKLFFIKNDNTVIEFNDAENLLNEPLKSDVMAIYKGRVWVAQNSALHFSALGKYNDFTTENDAGYIENFHNDTESIIALKPYREYLAIYKKNSVYLLSGSSPEDFSIQPFADRGACSSNGVLT